MSSDTKWESYVELGSIERQPFAVDWRCLMRLLDANVQKRIITADAITHRLNSRNKRGPRLRNFCRRPSAAKRANAMAHTMARALTGGLTSPQRAWLPLSVLPASGAS